MNIKARALASEERLVLDLLLSNADRNAQNLRLQARDVLVTGRCDCGCPTIYLTPADDTPRATISAHLWTTEGHVDPEGDQPGQEIILFLDDGKGVRVGRSRPGRQRRAHHRRSAFVLWDMQEYGTDAVPRNCQLSSLVS